MLFGFEFSLWKQKRLSIPPPPDRYIFAKNRTKRKWNTRGFEKDESERAVWDERNLWSNKAERRKEKGGRRRRRGKKMAQRKWFGRKRRNFSWTTRRQELEWKRGEGDDFGFWRRKRRRRKSCCWDFSELKGSRDAGRQHLKLRTRQWKQVREKGKQWKNLFPLPKDDPIRSDYVCVYVTRGLICLYSSFVMLSRKTNLHRIIQRQRRREKRETACKTWDRDKVKKKEGEVKVDVTHERGKKENPTPYSQCCSCKREGEKEKKRPTTDETVQWLYSILSERVQFFFENKWIRKSSCFAD